MHFRGYGYPTLKRLPQPKTSRYFPECDGQILGHHEVFRIAKDFENSRIPRTPVTVLPLYCRDCETTWLVGLNGVQSAEIHPSHNALFHNYSGQSRRSMMVHMHGACSGGSGVSRKSSAGIFVGPGSSYNLSHTLPLPDLPNRLPSSWLLQRLCVKFAKWLYHNERRSFAKDKEFTWSAAGETNGSLRA